MNRIAQSLLATLTIAALAGAQAQAPANRIDLRVLYAGSAEGPRTADFVAFLRTQFTEVGTATYSEFTPA